MVRGRVLRKVQHPFRCTTGCCQWPPEQEGVRGQGVIPDAAMKQHSVASNGEFVWPSLTLFFSLLVSTSCIGLFTYVLLLFVGF